MPEPRPQPDAELLRLLDRLALDDLPPQLHGAVAEAVAWAVRLDREAAERAAGPATRPR